LATWIGAVETRPPVPLTSPKSPSMNGEVLALAALVAVT
jgi:hypothetical protein